MRTTSQELLSEQIRRKKIVSNSVNRLWRRELYEILTAYWPTFHKLITELSTPEGWEMHSASFRAKSEQCKQLLLQTLMLGWMCGANDRTQSRITLPKWTNRTEAFMARNALRIGVIWGLRSRGDGFGRDPGTDPAGRKVEETHSDADGATQRGHGAKDADIPS